MTARTRNTLRIAAVILALWGTAFALASTFESLGDSPIGVMAAGPFLTVYVFHLIGIPGVLEHDGACGWGWCAPTPFGIALLVVFWLAMVWGVSYMLASMATGPKES